MMDVEELKRCGRNTFDGGYRVVFFYEDKYQIGSWVSDIENFMYDFVEVEPIEDDEDIPKFISIDDILDRWIKKDKRLIKVAIYSVEGNLIQEKKKKVNDEKYYRVTYDGIGIYEALKMKVTREEWKGLLFSDKFKWLPKPALYNDNNRSYFTKLGYEKFNKETLPIMLEYLTKDKIKVEKIDKVNSIIYEDEYQVIAIID